MVKEIKIGVLALQGDVIEHIKTLQALKVQTKEVRLPTDLQGLDGLILPGGESTTISKLLIQSGIDKAIKHYHKKGMAVFGSCAGAIIICKKIVDEKIVKPLRLIDITVQRNAFGPQLESFETDLNFIGEKKKFHAAFIRAPIIKSVGTKTTVLSEFKNQPVLVAQDNVLVSTFHT